jgi:hypothetical protein
MEAICPLSTPSGGRRGRRDADTGDFKGNPVAGRGEREKDRGAGL